MKVEQITLSAGPDGVFQPGTVREVSEEQGRALIACGAARAIGAREVAAFEPEETAAAPEPRRRVRRRGESDDND